MVRKRESGVSNGLKVCGYDNYKIVIYFSFLSFNIKKIFCKKLRKENHRNKK